MGALRKCEAVCAEKWQEGNGLAGEVEADATALRKYSTKDGLTWIQLSGLVQRSSNGQQHKVHLHLLPLKQTVDNARPPQESGARILATGARASLRSETRAGRPTVLISDGAPCYGSLAANAGVRHEHCNHAGGVFVKAVRRGPFPALMVHTGTIDALWQCLKDHVPASLCTRVQKSPRESAFDALYASMAVAICQRLS